MRLLSALLSLFLLGSAIAAAVAIMAFSHYSKDLPEYDHLKDYHPPTLSRIYADDGRMMAVVAAEQRLFVPMESIPQIVIDAFLSAEDSSFYDHKGVDYTGIIRAALINLRNVGTERHPMGASTITQQIAKNMLLSNEVSIARKIREAILATRLEKALSKERLLEIYLNQIFLGSRSYGIAAAALNYFNKSLDELTADEAAYLAALPKAPNNYHPVRNYNEALGRRNWVLGRMVETGRLPSDLAKEAQARPLMTRSRADGESVSADYFSEEVRRQLVDLFGEKQVTEGGLAVKTSLDPKLQHAATKALRDGLITFDRRNRGWRGPVSRLTDFSDWQKKLKDIPVPPGAEFWQKAIVTDLAKTEARLAFADGTKGVIPWEELSWARHELPDNRFGPPVRSPADVLKAGEVVMVEAVKANDQGKPYPERTFTLRQVPVVQGAIIALDPHTGRVFAMTGGFSSRISQFNRATQAMRQPGSAFKPFLYLAALDKGFTPASLISDDPAEYFQGPGLPLWRPENFGGENSGPLSLRQGIEKSKNVMTVRLAHTVGMPTIVEYARKFLIVNDMPELLSFSLGAKETTPLRLATAYGMIVNGGKKIIPTIVDRVQDRTGKTIWRADARVCADCRSTGWTMQLMPPDIPDMRQQIQDPRTAYQMVSILQGAVQRGTAVRLRDINFPLAGKTGTTNESKDAWFVGFTPDLVCAVYVGFDNPVPLGSRETGSSVALPIFRSFITEAIKDKPPVPFRMPSGLRMVRVNPLTGALAMPSDKTAIWEAFLPGTEPQEGQTRPVLQDKDSWIANGHEVHETEASYEAEQDDHTFSADQTAPDSFDPFYSQPRAPRAPSSTTGTGGLY